MAKKNNSNYGHIMFIVGLLIALVAGLISLSQTMVRIVLIVLVILGILIGIMNIKENEVVSFLLSAIALVILTGSFLTLLAQNFTILNSQMLSAIFGYVIALVVPATIIVALKTLYATAKN